MSNTRKARPASAVRDEATAYQSEPVTFTVARTGAEHSLPGIDDWTNADFDRLNEGLPSLVRGLLGDEVAADLHDTMTRREWRALDDALAASLRVSTGE